MHSILLHIHDDPCLDARIQVAFDLARTFDGHITCLQVVPYEYGVPGDPYGTMAVQFYPVIRESAAKLREVIELRLSKEDVRWDWVCKDGMAQDHLLVHAGLSDVIVMGACTESRSGAAYSRLAAEVAIGAATPIMLVPEKCKGLDASAPAAVAWNGSPEASRALRAAVPLLQRSSEVFLLTVTGDEPEFDLSATEGASYLSRHGIESKVLELPPSSEGIRDTLVHAAQIRKTGWIAMGAYGHTRLRERVLGGVSRSMMSGPELPILMAH